MQDYRNECTFLTQAFQSTFNEPGYKTVLLSSIFRYLTVLLTLIFRKLPVGPTAGVTLPNCSKHSIAAFNPASISCFSRDCSAPYSPEGCDDESASLKTTKDH